MTTTADPARMQIFPIMFVNLNVSGICAVESMHRDKLPFLPKFVVVSGDVYYLCLQVEPEPVIRQRLALSIGPN
jgi:hypothetical protein